MTEFREATHWIIVAPHPVNRELGFALQPAPVEAGSSSSSSSFLSRAVSTGDAGGNNNKGVPPSGLSTVELQAFYETAVVGGSLPCTKRRRTNSAATLWPMYWPPMA